MSGEFVWWVRLRESSFFPRHQIGWTQQNILRNLEHITNRHNGWNHKHDNDLVVKHWFVTTTNKATLTERHEWMRTTTSKIDDVFVCRGAKEKKCDVFAERKKFALILKPRMSKHGKARQETLFHQSSLSPVDLQCYLSPKAIWAPRKISTQNQVRPKTNNVETKNSWTLVFTHR